MRHYSISSIALIVEKKGVDAVRWVSFFSSVTLSVTILILIYYGSIPDLTQGLLRQIYPTSFFWICLRFV